MSKTFYGLLRVDGIWPRLAPKVDVWIPVFDIKYCDRGDSEFIFSTSFKEATDALIQRYPAPNDYLTFMRKFSGDIIDPDDGTRRHVENFRYNYMHPIYAVLPNPENISAIHSLSLDKIEKWLAESPETRIVRVAGGRNDGALEFLRSDYYRHSNVVFSTESRTLRYDNKIAERRQKRLRNFREKKLAERMEEDKQRKRADEVISIWRNLYTTASTLITKTPPFHTVCLNLDPSVSHLHNQLFSFLDVVIKVAASRPKRSYLDYPDFTNAVFQANAAAKNKESPIYQLTSQVRAPEGMLEETRKGFELLDKMARAISKRRKQDLKKQEKEQPAIK
jgi:hypothetical protein